MGRVGHNDGGPSLVVNLSRTMQVYKWIKNAHFALLPPACLICAAPASGQMEICDACRRELPWQSSGCRTCALTLPDHADAAHCRDCQLRAPPFDTAHAAFRYASPVSELITGLKFNARLACGQLLGTLFCRSLPEKTDLPERLIPVPLHPRRQAARGFNQAGELALHMGGTLGIGITRSALVRVRPTSVQSDLPARRRAANVKGAFRANPDAVAGRHLALVDDVVTTSQTARAAATALRRAGARRVDLWCLARA